MEVMLLNKSSADPAPALKLTRRFKLQVLLTTTILIILSLTGAAVLIYFTAEQEVSRSFFSAHRDLRNIWKDLLPVVVMVAGGFAVLASLIMSLVLIRFKRSLERSGQNVLQALELLGRGNLKAPFEPAEALHLAPLAQVAKEAAESFQQHVQEVKGISVELHRTVMRLNYVAFEEGQVTLADIKSISTNLNTLSRELTNSLKWFES
jgi:methyl-accepting chemotaxis protein